METGKLLTNAQINDLAVNCNYEYRVLRSIIQVESGQHGFDPVTGKIIIQFEPSWFKRLYKEWAAETKHTTWQNNKVGNQAAEWEAFNSAFAVNADAAMKSTSIGMMQVMGFHYAETGFKKVGRCGISQKRVNITRCCLPLDGSKQYRRSTWPSKTKTGRK